MDAPWFDVLLSVCLGLALAAACGFRIFLPPLILSAAAMLGKVELTPGLQFLGTWPALTALAVAVVVELAAYYVPWLDNLMDALGAPLAVGAGIVLAAAPLVGVSPVTRWTLAVVAGGAAAGGVHLALALVRKASSLATGGVANHLVATAEAIMSVALTVLALVVPLLAILCVAIAVAVVRHAAGRRTTAGSPVSR